MSTCYRDEGEGGYSVDEFLYSSCNPLFFDCSSVMVVLSHTCNASFSPPRQLGYDAVYREQRHCLLNFSLCLSSIERNSKRHCLRRQSKDVTVEQ